MDDHLIRFVERCIEHVGKRIDNTSLPAGSPMHYYCRHCSAPTETLPEPHRQRPVTVCAPCQLLEEQGLLAEAQRALGSTAMDDGARDRYRCQLKLEMLQALGPDTCAQTLYWSRDEVLGLIKSGEADLLVSVATGRLTTIETGDGPTKHYAVRFNDRDLGERARQDCLDLYGLRSGRSSGRSSTRAPR
jgi:hypothetical protein